MEINIRENIKQNFKQADKSEIKVSIEESIKANNEITLPGLGIFFEILWNHSDEMQQEYILTTLEQGLK
ncbi:MAG: small acid-soluble spore protein SspI [Bacilli bacterium]